MAQDVIMPVLGMSQDSGMLLNWLKQEGEVVQKGEPLMEVETDKATVEIEAPASGVLTSVRAAPGDDIPVGEVIAIIVAPGEALPEQSSRLLQSAPDVAPSPASVRPTLTPGDSANPVGVTLEARPARASFDGKLLASPKAKRLAQERGLELAQIPGSGPDKAVIARDVLAYGQDQDDDVMAPELQTVPNTAPAYDTHESWRGTTADIEATLALDKIEPFLAWANKRSSEALTYADFLVRFVAVTLRKVPTLNAYLEESIAPQDDVRLMLRTPGATKTHHIFERAQHLNLQAIARIRQREQGGASGPVTFTLFDVSHLRVDRYRAGVTPPSVASLTVGRQLACEGKRYVTLTLSYLPQAVGDEDALAFFDALASLHAEPLDLIFLF